MRTYGCLLFLLAGLAQAQEMELQVALTTAVSTETSKKGDPVVAKIVSPAGFQGSTLEGKITESVSGAEAGGQSTLMIGFDTLRQGRTVTPVNSKIKSAANSKGQVNLDEEGRALGAAAKDRGGKLSSASRVGRAFGAIPGTRSVRVANAVENSAATMDSAAAALGTLSSPAPNLRFDAGSTFVVSAASRGGRPLASLASVGPAPAPVAAAPAPSAPPAPAAAAARPATASPQEPAAAGSQPDMTVLKADFVPGEKTLFFDDFTDMTADDAPPHFKVRGAAPQLRAAGNIRQLTVVQRGSLFPNITKLPKNFTIEAEVKADAPGRAIFNFMLSSQNKQILHVSTTASPNRLDIVASLRSPYQELGRTRATLNWNEPVKLGIWVQDGRLRVFTNGEKQLDFNQVEMPLIDNVEIAHDFYGANQAIGYRMVRFAESTPDFSQVISSSGRYVSYGILFDTDSDRLKPESAPVIKQIARGLETNPALKLRIEGHTDSVGDAAHNLDLSKRRAEAVMSVLATQFKVDASRLTAAGLGATKPVETNDTPQGRAQNRRVEFVRQ